MNSVRKRDLSRTSWMMHICWIFAQHDMQVMPHCQRLSSGSRVLTWSPVLLMGQTLGLSHSQAASMIYSVLLLPLSVRTGVAYCFALRVIWFTICPPFTELRRRRPDTYVAMISLWEACARNGVYSDTKLAALKFSEPSGMDQIWRSLPSELPSQKQGTAAQPYRDIRYSASRSSV